MLFTSLEFLFLFLPAVLLLHALLPLRGKNVWLFAAGLLFYAWGEVRFVWVMLLSILFNYAMARLIDRFPRWARACLVGTIVGNLGMLFVFKYSNFFTSLLHPLIPAISVTAIPLPIGISFFTFQAMSYVIDVYRGEAVQKDPISLGLYVSLFPQLIAGPIVRYPEVAREIGDRRVTRQDLAIGIGRFLRGFNKKMLLANTLSIVADAAFFQVSPALGLAWIGIIAYALQIYFDFAGYSEMAIGLGRMLGFSFPENFNDPYISGSVSEFWRRWHITLGAWFRDYLYFPLGGSRVSGKGRLLFNLLVVWLATGIWHGAAWNFILWGLWYGIWIAFEKLVALPRYLEHSRTLRLLYRPITLLAVLVGWVFFRADTLPAALNYFAALLGFGGGGASASFYLREHGGILLVALLCATPALRLLRKRIDVYSERGGQILGGFAFALQLVLFFVGVSFLVMDAHNPFIYFNF